MSNPTSSEFNGPLLPSLAGEDYSCSACEFDYSSCSPRRAAEIAEQIPVRAATEIGDTPTKLLNVRPDPDTWSVIEYLAHIRDVYASYAIRLFRTRSELRPALEPMLNDMRTKRFRYGELAADVVLLELRLNVSGFLDEIARTVDWDRVATRLPSEVRTARWMVRQAAHEGIHHLRDIAEVRERLLRST
jgi:DinB superfamily